MTPTQDCASAVTLARARARTYVLSRQSSQGGFCAYRSDLLDEPNLSDTWHALASLALLDTPVPDSSACARFVTALPVEEQAHALYYRVRILRALQCPDPKADQVREAIDALVARVPSRHTPPAQVSGRLDALRHVVWLRRYAGPQQSFTELVRAVLQLQSSQGGFPHPPDLVTTQAAWAVLRLCGVDVPPGVAEYVQCLATPGYGYRLTNHSLSPNIETLCAGVQCATWAQRPVAWANDALRFLLACQGGRGGFARAPGALPDLICTHRVLEGLQLLSGGPNSAAAT